MFSSMNGGLRAFIFDMDGTLLNNMAFHTAAWMETIEALGHGPVNPVDWELQTSGVPNRTILAERLGVAPHNVSEWVEWKEAAYRRLALGRLKPLPGARAFLRAARKNGVRLAMATGAGPANIRFNLTALEMEAAFETIVGADDVEHGKPDPEVFLKAAKKLGVPPSNCVVFEDAPLGIEAARRAGMRVVAFTTMLKSAELMALPGVNIVADDFTGLDATTT
jgi:beta-phosphoglucomutase family hydrolase